MPGLLPRKKELEAAVAVASTAEASWYLVDAFKEKAIKERAVPECQDTLVALEKNALYKTQEREGRPNPFDSKDGRVLSDFENFHGNIQKNTKVAILKGMKNSAVELNIAMNKESHVVRSFLQEGKKLSSDMAFNFDNMFHAWLVSQHLICVEGILYHADKGNPQYPAIDRYGVPRKLSQEDFSLLIQDKETGFAAFLGKDVKLSVAEHAYPQEKEPHPVVPAAISAKAAPEATAPQSVASGHINPP